MSEKHEKPKLKIHFLALSTIVPILEILSWNKFYKLNTYEMIFQLFYCFCYQVMEMTMLPVVFVVIFKRVKVGAKQLSKCLIRKS